MCPRVDGGDLRLTQLYRYPHHRGVYITLKVDGVAAATSTILPTDSGTSGFFPMAINTIQRVDAGQSVTIEWYGDGYIFSSDSKYAHFTGEFLGYLPTHM